MLNCNASGYSVDISGLWQCFHSSRFSYWMLVFVRSCSYASFLQLVFNLCSCLDIVGDSAERDETTNIEVLLSNLFQVKLLDLTYYYHLAWNYFIRSSLDAALLFLHYTGLVSPSTACFFVCCNTNCHLPFLLITWYLFIIFIFSTGYTNYCCNIKCNSFFLLLHMIPLVYYASPLLFVTCCHI